MPVRSPPPKCIEIWPLGQMFPLLPPLTHCVRPCRWAPEIGATERSCIVYASVYTSSVGLRFVTSRGFSERSADRNKTKEKKIVDKITTETVFDALFPMRARWRRQEDRWIERREMDVREIYCERAFREIRYLPAPVACVSRGRSRGANDTRIVAAATADGVQISCDRRTEPDLFFIVNCNRVVVKFVKTKKKLL